MKKIFGILVLVMLAVCSVLVVSCGDDDDDAKSGNSKEAALIGSWVYEDVRNDESATLVFKSDHEFRLQEVYNNGDYSWDTENDFGTWSLEGSTINMKFDDGERVQATFDGVNVYLNGYKFTKK